MSKKLYLFAALFLAALTSSAQAPQGIPYQAIARDNSGNPLVNQPVSFRFSVHDQSAGGTVVYSETHSLSTNEFGLVNLTIGAGNITAGTFDSIDWGGGSKFLQVELDPSGGAAFTDMGTTQMMSVPYALHSGSSDLGDILPSSPDFSCMTIAATVATGNSADSSPNSVAIVGNYVFVVNVNDYTMQTIDISNPAAPTIVATISSGGEWPWELKVSGNYAYIVNRSTSNMQVIDITDPLAPMAAGSVNTGATPHSLTVVGNYAYVVCQNSSTLEVIDISNPNAPAVVGTVATSEEPWSVAVSGNYAYVVNSDLYTGTNSNLQVFDISNPASPTSVGSAAAGMWAGSVAISGTHAFVTNYGDNAMQVFDISNPVSPLQAGSVATGAGPFFVTISGNYALITVWNDYFNATTQGMQIIDISNPATPAVLAMVGTGAVPSSIAVSGNYAYVANRFSGNVQVISLTPCTAAIVIDPNTGEVTSQSVVPLWISSGNDISNANTGKVGIGTTNPNGVLHIKENNSADELVVGENVWNSNDAANRILLGNPDGSSFIRAGQAADHYASIGWVHNANPDSAYVSVLAINGANPLVLQRDGGNVGIGTTAPSHKLEVRGNMWLGTQQSSEGFTTLDDVLYLGSPRKYLSNTLGGEIDGSIDWINLMAHPFSSGIMLGTSGPSDTDPHSGPNPLMVIRSDGRVGIGTTTPESKLHLYGPGSLGAGTRITFGDDYFSTENDAVTYVGEYGWNTNTDSDMLDVHGDGGIHFTIGRDFDLVSDAFRTAMFVDGNSGNVGIGTTVTGGVLHINEHNTSDELIVGENLWSVNDGVNRIQLGNSDGSSFLRIGDAADRYASIGWVKNEDANLSYASMLTSNGANPLVLQRDGGNVGIGTINPESKLSLYGTGSEFISVRSAVGNNTPLGGLYFGTSDPAYSDQWAGIVAWREEGVNKNSLAFYTSNGTRQDRMFISELGYVGIGTGSPSKKLTINDGGTQLRLENPNAGGGSWEIAQSSDGWGIGGGKLAFIPNSSSSADTKVVFTNSGNVGIGASNPWAKLQVETGGDQVYIHGTGNNNQFSTGGYPLFVDAGYNGILVRTYETVANSGNNFISFWDGDYNVNGRIEGQTYNELINSHEFVFMTTMNAVEFAFSEALSLAAAVSLPPDVAESLVHNIEGVVVAAEWINEANEIINDQGVSFASGYGDYAEWLERTMPEEEILPGDIVGVVGGKISKNTASASQLLIVSTAPIVLGNMPETGMEESFEKVAFMGQVPVRVKGIVHVGDYILATGNNDGYGVAVNPAEMKLADYSRIAGVAWSEFSYAGQVGIVNAAVGINTNDLVAQMAKQQQQIDELSTGLSQLASYLKAKDPDFDLELPVQQHREEVASEKPNTTEQSEIIQHDTALKSASVVESKRFVPKVLSTPETQAYLLENPELLESTLANARKMCIESGVNPDDARISYLFSPDYYMQQLNGK